MPVILQQIIITLWTFITGIDDVGFQMLSPWNTLILGLVTGDLHTAVTIAGTFTLMSLGNVSIGGASVPNYGIASLVGTFVAINSGTGINTAVAVGIPIGLLAIQLDIAAKILNNFVIHASQRYNKEHKFKREIGVLYLGPLFFGLQKALPTGLVIFAGPALVKAVLAVIPAWVTTGFTIAGNMLPAVGIALLLHYLPIKKYATFLVVGFVLTAYLKVPVLGVSMVALGAAYWIFTNQDHGKVEPATANGADSDSSDESGDDFDE